MNYQGVLITFITSLTVISCGKHPRHDSPPAIEVIYDSSVPKQERELVELDLKTLHWASPSDVAGKSILGLQEISRDSLSDWLQQRFRYLIGSDYDYSSKLRTSKLQSPTIQPTIFSQDSGMATLMLNCGSAIYSATKQTLNLISAVGPVEAVMQIGNESIVINSPRVGVIQLGEIYRHHERIKGFSGDIDSLKNSLLRLSTFFHEARHSDGNGENVGFSHVKCDSGDFRGKVACDDSSNGAYTVSKVVLQSLLSSCSDCDIKEKKEIELWISDLSLRVNSNAKEKDPRPEKMGQRAIGR